jgi:hypothetical protein
LDFVINVVKDIDEHLVKAWPGTPIHLPSWNL